MPMGPEMGLLQGSRGLHRLISIRKYVEIFSETKRFRALIFSILVSPSGPLPSLLKLCPWADMGPSWSHMYYIGLYWEYRERSGSVVECLIRD